jgi:hypothetical protein
MTLLAISLWIMVNSYLNYRGRYTVKIMVNGKIIHNYHTNYLPIIGDVISVDGKIKAYHVKQRFLFRTKNISERIIVECTDISQSNETTTETP